MSHAHAVSSHPAERPSLKRDSLDAGRGADASHARKRPRTRAHVYRVTDLDLSRTLQCGVVTKANMCTLVPITGDDAKSLFVQLSGGGDIPLQFGLGAVPDNPEKFKLSLNVADQDEHEALERMTGQLADVAVREWKNWFPGNKSPPSEALVKDLCYTLVSEKRERRGAPGQFYPGLFNATFDTRDIESARCRVVHGDTKETVSFHEVPGMKWSRAIVELRHIFIQGSKSYGLTKRLRYLEVIDGPGEEDVVPLDV